MNMYTLSMEGSQRISSYINMYCSDSLNELTIKAFNSNLLLKWTKPFKSVSSLHFGVGTWNCEENNKNLSEIFPSLRLLDISELSISNSKCIDYYFPLLEHIEFSMDASYPNNNAEIYRSIFHLIPQLRSIHIKNINNLNILRLANKKLHYLEAIELTDTNVVGLNESEVIHFKNVKRFFMTDSTLRRYVPSLPLKFNQLEEFSLDNSIQMTETWI